MVMETIIDAIRSQWFFSIHWLHGKDMTCLTFFPGPNDFWPRTWASLPDSWDVCILFLILIWVFSYIGPLDRRSIFFFFSRQHWYLLVLKFWLIAVKALLDSQCTNRGRFCLLSLHFLNTEEMLTNTSQLQVYYLSSPSLNWGVTFMASTKPSDRHCRLAASCHSWLCSTAKGRAGRRLTCNSWSFVCICWIIETEQWKIFSSHFEDIDYVVQSYL